jgi:hypothetical protein
MKRKYEVIEGVKPGTIEGWGGISGDPGSRTIKGMIDGNPGF